MSQKRGRPAKVLTGEYLMRDCIVLETYQRLRKQSVKHEIAVDDARREAKRRVPALKLLSLTNVKNRLKLFMPVDDAFESLIVDQQLGRYDVASDSQRSDGTTLVLRAGRRPMFPRANAKNRQALA